MLLDSIQHSFEQKKITNIPPLIENNIYISSFKEKAQIFNQYFAKQCHPLDTNSNLPPFTPLTNTNIDNFNIHSDEIVSIINKLNSKKASGFDGISIAMLQLNPILISIPLKMIFNKCLQVGYFPSQWKMANVQPVH